MSNACNLFEGTADIHQTAPMQQSDHGNPVSEPPSH